MQLLSTIPGIEIVFPHHAYFHEIVLKFNKPVKPILQGLAKQGIQSGYDLTEHYPELGECLLVCATETKTKADLQNFAEQLSLFMIESKQYA
jgi:glycine dehydrogenase subunit 1